MKKISQKLGFIHVRAVVGILLCLTASGIAMLALAAPAKAPRSAARTSSSRVAPTVINSTSNGISSAARDLPVATPAGTEIGDKDLPPVKPLQPVAADFVDKIVQKSMGTAAAPAPLASFEGQSASDSGCGCIPPDTTGAVGPNQYVQMVNSTFSVFAKDGTKLSGPTPINALFQSLPSTSRCFIDNSGDPIVVYDQLADRWVITQFAVGGGNGPTSSECVAVSKSGDATGQYYIYDFDLTNSNGKLFEDYPKLGLWPDAYYMSTHEFTFLNQTPAGAFQGAAAWALERDKMLVGQPARIVYFRLGAGDSTTGQQFFGGQQPSTLDGFALPPAGSPNYFVEVDAAAAGAPPDGGPTAATMRIWKFHVDWSNPANSTFGDSARNPDSRTPVADFAQPPCSVGGQRVYVAGCVPQAGDPSQLDPIGDRLMFRTAYRNFGDHESIVLNHTVVTQQVNGQPIQMGPRWYEVRNPGSSPVLFQQSTYGPTSQTDLLYRWMSSVAMDSAGDLAIGYSTSNSASFPSIAYAGRLAGDPVSTLTQSETQLFAGGGPQRGELFAPQTGRWGDYSTMTVDPLDDCTFWYTNEYFSATDAPTGIWHTRIGSFKFPQCTPRQTGLIGGVVTDAATGNPIPNATVTAGGYTAITAKNGAYQFSPLSPGSYSVTASAQGYFPSTASGATVTNGGNTIQNFALTLNPAQPTPTPPPTPLPLETVNPPVLTAPTGTTSTNSYAVTWNPAEVTANLDHYVIEESTDYVNPLFDNADDAANPPGQGTSKWTSGQTTSPWTENPTYHNSQPNSYANVAAVQVGVGIDSSLTLLNNITIPATVGSGRLTFWSRYFNDPDDSGNVEISTDGGNNWNSLKIISIASPFPPGTPPADTRMQAYELDLSAYRGIPFKLRYRFSNGSLIYFFIRTVGWWIDDINVDGATWHQIGTAAPNATSFTVFNRPSGHYYYRVRGVYATGSTTTNSNVQGIIVNAPAVLPTSASSRKLHNGTPYDVDLPLNGGGVEPRSGGTSGDYQIVIKFPSQITFSGASCSCGSVAGTTPSGNDVIVSLTGVSNASRCSVTLNGVNGGGNASIPVNFLIGDTNGDGAVNSADISQVKSQSGQPLGSNNFREDLNTDGNINSADISLVKSRSGTALP